MNHINHFTDLYPLVSSCLLLASSPCFLSSLLSSLFFCLSSPGFLLYFLSPLSILTFSLTDHLFHFFMLYYLIFFLSLVLTKNKRVDFFSLSTFFFLFFFFSCLLTSSYLPLSLSPSPLFSEWLLRIVMTHVSSYCCHALLWWHPQM